jgi:hypothetical protein
MSCALPKQCSEFERNFKSWLSLAALGIPLAIAVAGLLLIQRFTTQHYLDLRSEGFRADYRHLP